MKTVLKILGAVVVLAILSTAFFAWSENYAIYKESNVEFGDSIDTVENKKGLLRSRKIGLEDVNPAYHSEDWITVAKTDGAEIRSYYLTGPNSPSPSGFVVIFDNEGGVFVVIPTDT